MNLLIQAVIMLVAAYVIQVAFGPKPINARPTAFDDIDFPQVDEGTPQCVIFGDCWVPDWTVLAVGNFRTSAIKTKSGK